MPDQASGASSWSVVFIHIAQLAVILFKLSIIINYVKKTEIGGKKFCCSLILP